MTDSRLMSRKVRDAFRGWLFGTVAKIVIGAVMIGAASAVVFV